MCALELYIAVNRLGRVTWSYMAVKKALAVNRLEAP